MRSFGSSGAARLALTPAQRRTAATAAAWSLPFSVAIAEPWLPPGEMYLNESVALPRLTAPADHGSFWP